MLFIFSFNKLKYPVKEYRAEIRMPPLTAQAPTHGVLNTIFLSTGHFEVYTFTGPFLEKSN